MKYQDLMIDFETLGQDPDTAVISIGACFFDEVTNQIGPTFYMAFEIDSQLKAGRTIKADTLRWWMGQSGAAKKVFNEKAQDPKAILELFSKWVLEQNTISKIKPWGNGSTFDISIIEDLFRMYDVKCPWLYYNVFDLRTFKRYIANGAKVVVDGTAHNALDDAIAQAKYVMEHYGFFQEMIKAFEALSKQGEAT